MILNDLTQTELLAKIEAMQAENDRLRKAATSKITLKVSDKGAVSLYGMGRFPVTLYRTQWERVLDNAETIRAFIEAHKGMLAEKD